MREETLEILRKERDKIIESIQKGNKREKIFKNKIVGALIEEHKEFELDPEETNKIYLCRGKNYRGILRDGIYQLDIIGKPESVKCGWYCNIESEIDNYLIPSFPQILDFVKELHFRLPYFRLIGWDVSVDMEGNPVMIEWNRSAELSQVAHGPAFGDYTEEILANARTGINTRFNQLSGRNRQIPV